LLDTLAERGSGHTPNKSHPEYWNGGVKWVSLADSSKLDNLYVSDTDKNISELGIINSSAVKHPRGTVILSRDAGIGKSAVLFEEMAVSQHFMAWRCGNRMDSYFLYFWMQYSKPKFEAIAMGSTIPTIGLGFFKRLKIAAPHIKEQQKIGMMFLKVHEFISVLESDLDQHTKIKKGLMQDLLTGRVRVSGSDEVANA
jgi:type I restriction enzyme S subunit